MKDGRRVIAVLQRGWVVTGITVRDEDDADGSLHLEQASVIRRWGTTRGLGQLALKGPQQETVLDPCGTVLAHEGAVVMVIPCVEAAWRES